MYSKMNKLYAVCILASAVSSFSHVLWADDAVIKSSYEHALGLYNQRSNSNPRPVDGALAELAQIEGKADQADLNYQILILESRSLYFRGNKTMNVDEKKKLFLEGQAKADAAKKLNDKYAEAYYFAGVNLARWGEAQGVLASLGKKNELMAYMNETLKHLTLENQPGETLDGYGVDRVLGRVYFKVPSLFGGSRSKALDHLNRAYEKAKDDALNVVFYAEALMEGKDAEKAHAKQILDQLLAQDPNTYSPGRVPETVDDFDLARALRAKLR